jgi:hypothetical protein
LVKVTTPTVAKAPLPIKFAAAEKHMSDLPALGSFRPAAAECVLLSLSQILKPFNRIACGVSKSSKSAGELFLAAL